MTLTLEDTIKETSHIANEKLAIGYKISEIGIIPEDWEVNKIEDLVTFIGAGKSKPKERNTKFPVFGSTGIIGYNDNYDYKDDAILIARVGANAGRVNIVKGLYGVTDNTIILKFQGSCDINFIFNVLEKSHLNKFIFGSGQPLITGSQIKNLKISIPILQEQQAIAAALSDIDSLINSLDQLIAKKRNIKLATLQGLLTRKQRLSGFKGELESKRLADLGEFRGGCGFPLKYQGEREGDYPFFKVSDMNNNGNEMFMTGSNNYISEQIRKNIGATIFPKNTIIFAKVGAAIFLERKRILAQMSCIDNNVMGFVLKEKTINLTYLYYLFLSFSFGKLVCTTALPSLNGKEIGNLLHDFPSLSEQTAIANVLSDMDTELSSIEQQLDKARNLKQGMMQELLTGRIRLT